MDSITPLKQYEQFFADLYCSATGLDQKFVLLQFPTQGQQSAQITQNVGYVKVSPEPDERGIYKVRKMVYNGETNSYDMSQQSTRTLTLQIIAYGPDCFEYMWKFNELLYVPEFKYNLDAQKLFIVPDRTNGPYRIQELHNGQWYQRCDMEWRFYNPIVVEQVVPTFSKIDIRTEVE